jgi:transcriptional regulator of arginine metabolism
MIVVKEKRQAEIVRIITEQDIDTQELLLEQLSLKGIKVTQATISRDIKELHLIKEPVGNGSYRYAVAPSRQGHHSHAGRLRNIFKEGVLSVDIAQNIIVVKTMPGLASAAGAALDGMEIDGFVGSLAGDDTVILIMRTNQYAEEFLDEIKFMLE